MKLHNELPKTICEEHSSRQNIVTLSVTSETSTLVRHPLVKYSVSNDEKSGAHRQRVIEVNDNIQNFYEVRVEKKEAIVERSCCTCR